MAEGERSEATIRAELLAEAMKEKAGILAEALRIPMGMEKVSPSEYRRRWASMTREQRLEEINRIGVDQVYKQLGEENARTK